MNNNKSTLNDLPNSLVQHLSFIDFSLLFKGHIEHRELQQRFSLDSEATQSAFKQYHLYAANNLQIDKDSDTNNVRYFQSNEFKPLIQYDVRKTLVKLTNKISDGYDAIDTESIPMQNPSVLNSPDLLIVARLSQAIMNGNTVNIIYTSLTSGSGSRDIVPHSIVDNGLRWHVRAFDRKTNSFRDFVLTRISHVSIRSNATDVRETKQSDDDWNRALTLTIVPHPTNIQFSTAIEVDYGMVDGELSVKTNAAMAGYLLRRWNVDCSVDASLRGGEYQLWLKNNQLISRQLNINIAPGL